MGFQDLLCHGEMLTKDKRFKLAMCHVEINRKIRELSPGGVLPYMGHIGICRCEGYGFQAVYSSIGYINQSVWV